MADFPIYSISQISSLLGISSQTLRNYEKAGLFESHRCGNNYRSFVSPDLTFLLYIMSYRNLSFSLSDIRRILKSDEVEMNYLLDLQIVELEKQKEKLEWQLKGLQRKKEELKEAFGNFNIEAVLRPNYYGYIFRKNKNLKDQDTLDTAQVNKLIRKMPYARQMLHIERKAFEDATYDYSIGVAISDNDLEPADKDIKGLLKIPASVCLSFSVKYTFSRVNGSFLDEEMDFMKREFEKVGIKEYMLKQGLTLKGDIIGLNLHHSYFSGQAEHIWRYYVPILPLPEDVL